MIDLTKIPDFRHFLSALLVKASLNEIAGVNRIFDYSGTPWFDKDNLSSKIKNRSFWFDHLSTYKIRNASVHKNFDYYSRTDISLANQKSSDIFTDVGFLIVNTNGGVMVLFFDETDSLNRLELNFSADKKMPSFLYDLVRHFPSENRHTDQAILKNLDKIGTLPINDYLKRFRRQRFTIVEVD